MNAEVQTVLVEAMDHGTRNQFKVESQFYDLQVGMKFRTKDHKTVEVTWVHPLMPRLGRGMLV